MMAEATRGNTALQQQPVSMTEDFIVIDRDSPSSVSPEGTPSPQGGPPDPSYQQLSLLNNRGSETDVQRLAKRIDEVSGRHASLHGDLSDNSGSLERLRGEMSDRLKEMRHALAEREAKIAVKSEQCAKLKVANRELSGDLVKLRNQQGEWEQTIQDYHKLKNAYGLLINTKERLESERDELQKNRSEALAAEAEKLRARFAEEGRAALQALRLELQTEREASLAQLKSRQVQATEVMQSHYEDEMAKLKALLAQATQELQEERQNLQSAMDTARAEYKKALDSERDKSRSDLDDRASEYRKDVDAVRAKCEELVHEQQQLVAQATQELEEERQSFRTALETSHAENEKALRSERDKCQSELAILVSNHQRVMEDLKRQFDEEIHTQEQLVAEARQQLHASSSQHEAEKNELLEQLKQLNISSSSIQCESSSNSDIATETDYVSLSGGNCSFVGVSRVANACVSVADATVRASLQSTKASVGTAHGSPEMASAAAAGSPTVQDVPADIELRSMEVQTDRAPLEIASAAAESSTRQEVPADIELRSKEIQTDLELQAEFQVANADSLQKESTLRNYQMQVATFAQTLRLERKKNERLAVELQRLRKECDQLRSQLLQAASQTASDVDVRQNASRQLQLMVDRLTTQLQAKQSELDSVFVDLDETRSKLYVLMDQVKYQQSGSNRSAGEDPSKMQQKVDQLTMQLQAKQSELDSVLEDFDETRHKVYDLLEQAKGHRSGQPQKLECEQQQKPNNQVQPASLSASAEQLEMRSQLDQVTKQLQAKQSELDSVLEDFDVTRHKVYELMEHAKGQQCGQQMLQQECEKLRAQLQTASQSEPARAEVRLQPGVDQLAKELQAKQSELDSVMKDLDETRHKVYELLEQAKGHQCRVAETDTQAEQLRQKIRELESQNQMDKSQHEMELDTARKEAQFKDTKLHTAEKEAEQMRLEVQRLKSVEDELQKRCRETNEAVQQMMANADQEKKGMQEKLQAHLACLEDNKNVLEQKALLEMQLRETIADLVDRLKLKAEESDKKQIEASRKHEQLYNRMCDQSEQRMQANQQLEMVKQQLEQTELQLRQTKGKLEESETFSAEMQTYSENMETIIDSLKLQLQESSRKRDEVTNIAEALRIKFEEQSNLRASVDSELTRLQLEHSKLRANYTKLEQSLTEMLGRENELQTQLKQNQHQLRQAEDAIDILKGKAQVAQMDSESMRAERDLLKIRVNTLIESLTQQQSNSSNDLFDKHRTLRPGGGNI